MYILGLFFLAFAGFLYMLFELMAIWIILILASAILSTIYFHQNKLLYMPVPPEMSKSPQSNPVGFRHPKDQNLESEDLILETSDGINVRGWHIKHQNPERIIVYFHENAGNIGYRIPLALHLSKRTCSDVILVAYRGYSDSDGYPTEEGLEKDAEAVIEYAYKYGQNKNLKTFLYGRSLGGAVSIYLGSSPKHQQKIQGLILENTFTSISDEVDFLMPAFKYVKFLLKNKWPSIERVPKIEKPMLFIRSMKDQIVPTKQMERLINNTDPNAFVEEYQIPNGTHNCSYELEKDIYFDRVYSFLKHERVK